MPATIASSIMVKPQFGPMVSRGLPLESGQKQRMFPIHLGPIIVMLSPLLGKASS